MVASLANWPWENLGSYKYVMYGPFVAQVANLWWHGDKITTSFGFHILLLSMLRGLVHQLWTLLGNMHFISFDRRVVSQGVDFEQIDREWDWDNFLILHAYGAGIACYAFPFLSSGLPEWDIVGLIIALGFHVAASEPLFYLIHRYLLHGKMYQNYHSLHHSSPVPQPFTAGHGTMAEQMMIIPIIGIPIMGAGLMGHASMSLIYGYILIFDFLRCFGHSNIEFIPHRLFDSLPFLKFLVYTPTYHSLHHTEQNTNFCLFMPLYDAFGNTLNPKSWSLHKQLSSNAGANKGRVADFVFLVHVVDLSSALHVPWMFRSFASMPYTFRWFILPCLPGTFIVMFCMWAWAKPFLVSFYSLRGFLLQTWVVPRFGFQYFLRFATKGINEQIEKAILKADRSGVKVLSLAALNKNEALNGGGTLFVKKHPSLKVRVVHGNTLTAAVILHEIHEHVKEVFLTGATSKLGRAIALYLCQRHVRVLMLTLSTERFQKIKKEAPAECQKYLVQVTKYNAAKNCKTWIVGKWVTPREQSWAPAGTNFHQFVVPPIFHVRRDCTYHDLAAMKLPPDVHGLSVCEYTMERGVVHACHAGGLVHLLEGWTHHEVGAIDVAKIDIVWEAAMKHGFKPSSA